MKHLFFPLRLERIVLLCLLLIPKCCGSVIGTDAPIIPIHPKIGLVEFKRVAFGRRAEEESTTIRKERNTEHWGAILINQTLMQSLQYGPGYINVFGSTIRLPPPGAQKNKNIRNKNAAEKLWLFKNIRVNNETCGDADPRLKGRIKMLEKLNIVKCLGKNRTGWSNPCTGLPLPKMSLFDLGKANVDKTAIVRAIVVLTENVLNEDDIQKLIQLSSMDDFDLNEVLTLNFEYDERDVKETERNTPLDETHVKTTKLPEACLKKTNLFLSDYWYKQVPEPNVDAHSKQCVSMAFANTLQYLEDSFFSYPFQLVEEHEYGELDGTLVGTLDKYMERQQDHGLSKPKAMRGLLNYLANNNLNVFVDHQGGDESYSCDEGCGELTSERFPDEHFPKFNFICNKIKQLDGVVLWYGRYKYAQNTGSDLGIIDQVRTGGHAVRVVECRKIGTEHRLVVIHDAIQGAEGNGGLVEWEMKQVEDMDNDGMLNFEDDDKKEIELIVAIKAKPSCVEIPDFDLVCPDCPVWKPRQMEV